MIYQKINYFQLHRHFVESILPNYRILQTLVHLSKKIFNKLMIKLDITFDI
jgi:hypothetical protein